MCAHGLYSSQITGWRKLRGTLILGGHSGATIGQPTRDQAEMARLKRRLADQECDLDTTQTALDSGKTGRAFGTDLQDRARRRDQTQGPLKQVY